MWVEQRTHQAGMVRRPYPPPCTLSRCVKRRAAKYTALVFLHRRARMLVFLHWRARMLVRPSSYPPPTPFGAVFSPQYSQGTSMYPPTSGACAGCSSSQSSHCRCRILVDYVLLHARYVSAPFTTRTPAHRTAPWMIVSTRPRSGASPGLSGELNCAGRGPSASSSIAKRMRVIRAKDARSAANFQ